MAILGGASTIRKTGVAQSQNASRRAASSRPSSRGTGARSYRGGSSGGGGGYGRSYSGGGGRSAGYRVSRPVQNLSRSTAPRRPAMPVPSADQIAALFNQIAGLKRGYGQATSNYQLQRSQLSTARGLYLKQLADAFQQSQSSALEDYAARGLADSGIAHEGLAKLGNEYQGQVSQYNSQYNDQLAQLLQQLQGTRSDNLAQRQALQAQYNRLQAQRAAALKMAGYGG